MQYFSRISLLCITILGVLVFCFFLAEPVFSQGLADQISGQINASARTAEVNPNAGDPQSFAVDLIKLFLSIIGMFFMILVIIAGYWWATARGDESKVEKAQKTLRSAVIGLIIVLAAYSITTFVGKASLEATKEQSEFNRGPEGIRAGDWFNI